VGGKGSLFGDRRRLILIVGCGTTQGITGTGGPLAHKCRWRDTSGANKATERKTCIFFKNLPSLEPSERD